MTDFKITTRYCIQYLFIKPCVCVFKCNVTSFNKIVFTFNLSFQLTMQTLNDDNSRLKTEAASAQATSTGELEALKTKTVDLEAANSSLSGEKTALLRNMEQLKADNETLANEKLTLAAEKEALAADKASMAAEKARLETLNVDKANTEDTGVTLKAQYDEQLAGVRQEMNGRVAELEGRCGEREREVAELTAQIEKCSTLKDDLKALSTQLSGEQTAKKVCM